ncbi:MAG: acetyltransferase [Nitrospirota bacterium]
MTADNKIILIGGGGHARVLIDLILVSDKFEIAGILDSELKKGKMVLNIPVLGSDNLLADLYGKGIRNACIAVGSIKDNSKRKMLYEKVKQVGFDMPYLIHPQAVVSKSDTRISSAVQIMAGVVIQPGVLIGENTIINTGAIVEHDCSISSHVHICPGTVISGSCIIGEGAFIGAGATIIHGVKIGKGALIGAGSVVIDNVPEGAAVKGVPAK